MFSATVVKETPLAPPRKTSLLRYDTSIPEIVEHSPGLSIPDSVAKPDTTRGTSTPNIGSVVMKNSTGIASMLGKGKRKRKDSVVKLVTESERIFAGKTFFFIPADDVAPIRKLRITKAQSYGAAWAKEWIPSITHVVVDKGLKYDDIMSFLKPLINASSLPPEVLLVNENYPIECIQFRSLVNPDQKRYLVEGYEFVVQVEDPQVEDSPVLDRSLETELAKPGQPNIPVENRMSLQNQPFTQAAEPCSEAESFPRVRLAQAQTQEAEDIESTQQKAATTAFDIPLRERDFLDDMIDTAKELEHLPLDDEEYEDGSSSFENGPSNSGDSDEELHAPKKHNKYAKKESFNQSGFSCMTGGSGKALNTNPNGQTIEILQEMADYYDRMQDDWRSRAYRKAIGILKKQTVKISTYDEAFNLPMVGERLAKKIEEIVLTNRLRRLESAKMEPNDHIFQKFLKIYGVGPKQAQQWIQNGHKTIEDLKAHAHLTKSESIGIKHYDDFNTRIPRNEVTAMGEFVKKVAATIDPKVECIIGGSYRRGAQTSGDVDFILTKPGTSSTQELHPFLDSLVDRLWKDNFLVAALATTKREGGSKWHGACVLPEVFHNIWRRIDLLLVPESEIGAALIYFTGDDIFNRSIRLLSSKKGMRLNQKGLYQDVMRGPGRVKVNEGSLIEGADEKKIFEILGVPWRPPEQRICH